MTDLMAPDVAIGGLALAAAVLYAAWNEYAAKNQRDAKALATVGALGLMASAAAWLQ